MRINLVAFENGVGNSRDIVLLKAALESLGHAVTVTAATRHARRRRKLGLVRAFTRLRWRRARRSTGQPFDLNVMLEHVWPEALRLAARNVLVPNPEFFDRHDRRMLDCFDGVWAKTRATEVIFTALGAPVSFLGFDSVDRYGDGARAPTCLHVAGMSRMKGTDRLVALWLRHPEWPRLTVVQSLARRSIAPVAPNLEWRTDYLSDADLKRLQNDNGIHLCTSETEGWGHYLAEAASTAAVVVATDAPPMNELVTGERGLLVAARAAGRQNLATTFEFDEGSFEQALSQALALGAAGRARLGGAARAWFLDNRQSFPARLARALKPA